jgi:PII-like signaling protein
MQGFQLKLYMHENRKHRGILLYEWLIEKAKELEIHGGSIFRAIAGFGRHGIIHEEHFFELASDIPVEATFILSPQECDRFLALLQQEKLDVFFVKIPVEYGQSTVR